MFQPHFYSYNNIKKKQFVVFLLFSIQKVEIGKCKKKSYREF